jgi:hypothetical protein
MRLTLATLLVIASTGCATSSTPTPNAAATQPAAPSVGTGSATAGSAKTATASTPPQTQTKADTTTASSNNGSSSTAGAATEWAVQGEWLDTCSCSIPCPCWKAENPTQKGCDDLLYFHVAKGHYGKVSLDGVDVIQVQLSAQGKTMMQSSTDGDFDLDNLYLSKKLSADQVSAVEAIFPDYLSNVPPTGAKKHAFKTVDLDASMGAKGATASIKGVLELEVGRAMTKGKPTPYPADMTVAPFTSAGFVGTQVTYTFTDDGFSWKLKGANASFAPFSWSSAQQAKAEAAAAASAPSSQPAH